MQKNSKDIYTCFLDTLIVINFLLSLLIVCHHAFTVNINYNGSLMPQAYGWTVGVQRMMYNISECAVPMFYFLSAYLFYRTYDGTWNKFRKKIHRRFFSLLVPYIIFCTLGYIKHLTVVGFSEGSFWGLLYSLWFCDTMPLWFIRELMALSLLAPLFYRIKTNKLYALGVSIALIVVSILGIVPYRSFLYWIPVYLMGAMLSNNQLQRLYTVMNNKRYIMFFLMLLCSYVFLSWFLPNGISREEMGWCENLIYIFFRVITPLVLLPLVWFVYKLHIRNRWFMRYSFFVYCMHAPIITLLTLVYTKTVIRLIDVEIVQYVIVIVGTYFFCVLLAMALQRYVPWLWSILNGKR